MSHVYFASSQVTHKRARAGRQASLLEGQPPSSPPAKSHRPAGAESARHTANASSPPGAAGRGRGTAPAPRPPERFWMAARPKFLAPPRAPEPAAGSRARRARWPRTAAGADDPGLADRRPPQPTPRTYAWARPGRHVLQSLRACGHSRRRSAGLPKPARRHPRAAPSPLRPGAPTAVSSGRGRGCARGRGGASRGRDPACWGRGLGPRVACSWRPHFVPQAHPPVTYANGARNAGS